MEKSSNSETLSSLNKAIKLLDRLLLITRKSISQSESNQELAKKAREIASKYPFKEFNKQEIINVCPRCHFAERIELEVEIERRPVAWYLSSFGKKFPPVWGETKPDDRASWLPLYE